MKLSIGVLCCVVSCGLMCGAPSAAVAEEYRIYGALPGGSVTTFLNVYADSVENHCWRWCLYAPRDCVYTIPSLGRTFRYVVTAGPEGLHCAHYELTAKSSRAVRNQWVLPAGAFQIRDESAQGAEYKLGIMGEPEKLLIGKNGAEHYFKGFVLIDGRVYSPWCLIVGREEVVSPLPAEPEEAEWTPIPSRNKPQAEPELAPPPPLVLPAPVLPPFQPQSAPAEPREETQQGPALPKEERSPRDKIARL
jgi:hypothetical protein